KAAVLSHRAVIAPLHAMLVRTDRLPRADGALPESSKALLSLPLFHIGGLQQILTPLVTGGCLVFTEGRFDPERIVHIVEEEGIKVWSAVPTMTSQVMDF